MREHNHRYRGVRAGQAGIVSVDGQPLPATKLAARLAPDGYDWGIENNGARALAHAVLTYEVDKRTADTAYQVFHQEVIAALPRGAGGAVWSLTSADIRTWLEAHQRIREAGEQR